ncbi:MarR family winged helix-turn-helix transcriptional regulator [Kangiella sp. HZ709]|uniref:MarR family winged helix-turn-helix transcriptional regulator n=1 Tax=Kangiella sp. HZ709 TaxID=2666328 RepID=UPI0018A1E05F|nr:helix-turn-helix domain-containing protein [Kangiella sp. HZ709]
MAISKEQKLLDLIRTVIFCHYRILGLGNQLDAMSGEVPVWNILKSIINQPLTVPDLAKERGVSRQYIQKFVNSLVADGLVEKVHNEQHKRSYLIKATNRGADTFRQMNEDFLDAVTPLVKTLDKKEMELADNTLKQLTESIAGFESL